MREQHDDVAAVQNEDANVLPGVSELCLLAALDPARFAEELGAERATAFCADARNAAEIAALRGFLGEVRAGIMDERRVTHSRAARRVTRRVLARSTREEHGWRGDLRLVGDFVSDRLRASAWLRVAAAALFVQVTVVPILAWHMLRDPGTGAFQFRFERPTAPPELLGGSDDLDASSELQVESPALDPTLPVLPFSEVAPALTALGERICAEYGQSRVPAQSARDVLAAGFGAAALGASATEQALADRALVLASGGRAEVAPALGIAGGSPSVAQLMQLEQALDRRALLGHASELSPLLEKHGATLATASAAAKAGSLAAAAQRRAVALRVVPHPVPGAGAGVERAEAALVPGAAYGEALGAELVAEGAADGPWARAWLRALAEQR